MLYNQTKHRSIRRRWMMAAAITTIATILLASLGISGNPVSAQTAQPVWRVDAQGNITKDNVIFRVRGGSWFGLQGRYEIASDPVNPRGAPMEQFMGNVFWMPSNRTYAQDAAEFAQLGINVVRLPLVHQTLANAPCDPQGVDPVLKNTDTVRIQCARTALETVIRTLDAAGIYVLLDIHSCSNYVDWRKGRLDARPPWTDATRENYDFKREDSSCAATNNPPTVTRIQAYNESLWLQDLTTLAGLGQQLGVTNIMGIDIFNEPHDYTWAEWKTLSEHAYNAINAVNPNILIFVEGVGTTPGKQDGTPDTFTQEPHGGLATNPNWGENLFSAGANPPAIPKNRLVFSPHTYGPSVFVQKMFLDPAQPECANLEGDAAAAARCQIVINPTLLAQGWDEHFGYLKAMGYAVVIGEFGGNMQWPGGAASIRDQDMWAYLTNRTSDQQWQNAFVDYLISRNIRDTFYWSINPESGDTGGIYTSPFDPRSNPAGWGTWGPVNQTKLTMLQRLWGPIQPTPTPTFTPTGPTPTATRTNTPTFTPTGPTPTRTNTPTITSTSGPTSLKVQYRAADTIAGDNQIKPHFNIVNLSTSAVPLSELKIRYWYTREGTQAQTFNCDHAAITGNCSNVIGTFVSLNPARTGADFYLEVGFSAAAGSIPAGGQSGEIQARFNKNDWSNYNETGDYSFDPTKLSFTDWDHVTLYRNGTLVWGIEPGGGTPTSTSVTPTATRTNTPTPTRTNTPITSTATRTNTPTFTSTATRTNTPTFTPTGVTNTPTRTPTSTRTNTPTITPTTGTSNLKLQYRAADTNAGDNQIKPHFNIVNLGVSAVPLSELKIRYWYTREGTQNQTFNCDFSAITGGCNNVTGLFVQLNPVRTGADFYVEVGFSTAAGSIAASGQSGEIQIRFNKTDWSNYNETGDYSFDPTKTSFADWTRVTLYRNGALVWGVEP